MARPYENPCSVAARILSEARWEAHDAASRRNRAQAAEYLTAHASELTLSPNACAQLLSVALAQAALDLSDGRQILAKPPTVFVAYDDEDEVRRCVIRYRVFQQAPSGWRAAMSAAALHTAALTPAREAGQSSLDAVSILSTGVLELQRRLWDHPLIPADLNTRLTMLLMIPSLATRLEYDADGRAGARIPARLLPALQRLQRRWRARRTA